MCIHSFFKPLSLGLVLTVSILHPAWARSTHPHTNKTHENTQHQALNTAQLACRVTISPREDREIIILKLQQRMDCLETRLDELNREVTVLRSH